MPEAETKAQGRTRGRAPTNEGAVIALDVSPPLLPPERPPIAFVRDRGTLDSTSKSANLTREPRVPALVLVSPLASLAQRDHAVVF